MIGGKVGTKKRYFINRIIICLYILGAALINIPNKAMAATEAEMDIITGNFTFTTKDTAASTNTTWSTIGFTVRRDASNGNPLKDNEYATFMIRSDQKVGYTDSNGTKTVTFHLTKAQVNAALKDSPLSTIKDNDTLYLSAIIRVKNGTKAQNVYKTLNGIKNAEVWRNPNDFNDRFDIRITYRAGNQKYPVKITYQLYLSANNYETVESKDCGEYINHDEFSLNSSNVPDSMVKNGETYYLYRTYYKNLPSATKMGNRKTSVDKNLYPDQYREDLNYIRNDRTFTVLGDETGGGLNVIAIYRRYPIREDSEYVEEQEKEYEEIDPTAVIGADTRGNESYVVTDGIPGTETLYANVFTSEYLAGSTFTRVFGEKNYTVNVKITYELSWATTSTDPETGEEVIEEHHETRPMTYTYNVKRQYSYWVISSLGVYGVKNATLENRAFPGGRITLNPSGYIPPTVDYTHSDNEADHLIEPEKIITVDLGTQSVSSSNIPGTKYDGVAEGVVPDIKCKNDLLLFNGNVIMSDSVKDRMADKPKEIPGGLREIGENVLYQPNLLIPGTMANGEYESTGMVTYYPIAELNPGEVDTTYNIDYVNSVVVHTPTVCDVKVQNNIQDNQMINPDKSRASLVLDRPFYVSLPTTGYHREIQGYGYRDYGKYIAYRQVKFPFDVYRGNSTLGLFIPKNTWTAVAEDTSFYLPTWVPEGEYTLEFRSIAINSAANGGDSKTESLANLELENYVATDTSFVQVSGRIYGLNIYDVTDYPIWENVFRLPNSMKMTGFKYTVGTKDQNGNNNGQNSKYTLTMVNGSHPEYKNQGILKTGYMTRFSLTTVGNMAEHNDYVRIRPTFYFVDKNGKNRQEVDIYYSETFNGKENVMVKMGGDIDLENDKSIKAGDPYLGIPEAALKQTAFYEDITLKKWKAQSMKVYNFMNIMLPYTLRTFVGYVNPVPSGVTEKQIASSVQKWYGEYYLPAEIHVASKDFDVKAYAANNGGLDYHESFWLKDGYIIVNFSITTVNNGALSLSYINAANAMEGYCNMWKREGYQYQKNSYGNVSFDFQDGDYVIYYANKNVKEDWRSSGTH